MERTKSFLVVGLVLLAVISAIYAGIMYWEGYESSERLFTVWETLFVLFLVWWVELDSRERAEIYRPYEYGFLVLIYWGLYVPYYFIQTRKLKGVLVIIALVLLFEASYIVPYIIYYVAG